jgi:hypothetical protein
MIESGLSVETLLDCFHNTALFFAAEKGNI